jgi:hypothetical protein
MVEQIIRLTVRLVAKRIGLIIRLVVTKVIEQLEIDLTKVIEQLGIDLTKVIERTVFMGRNFTNTILGLVIVLHTGLVRRNSSFMVIQQVVFKLIDVFPIFTNLNLRGLTF